MRLLNVLSGGYQRVMDRLLDLQNEAFTLGNAPLASLGVDLVLSGCAVTNNNNGTVNIAAGLIYVSGNTLRFDGAANIASNGSQTFVAGPVVTSTPRPFGDGSTKNIYSEQKAVIAAQDPRNNTQIKIKTALYNLQQYIKDQIYNSEVKGSIKEIYDLDGSFIANFDSTGLGVTPTWIGWAIDNGNNGTPGSAGMVIIGAGVYTDPISGLQTRYNNGDSLGEISHTLIKDELPAVALNVNGLTINNSYHTGGNSQHAAAADPTAALATTENMGLGKAHNTMQPSKAAYRVVKIV